MSLSDREGLWALLRKRRESGDSPEPVPAVPGNGADTSSEDEVVLTLPMSPSANALYRGGGKGSKGGVHLTDEAKRYANLVKDVVSKSVHVLKRDFSDLEAGYLVDITAYFPQLENAGWFEFKKRGPNAGERKAQSRYKVIDVDNRVKFAQDCVTKALGIPNDAQVFENAARKWQGKERVVVKIKVVDVRDYLEGHDE